MAFGKLISSSVVGATKNGIKMNLSIVALKDKAIDTVATQVEKQVPIELPFSTREVLNGGSLPTNLLTPEFINDSKDKLPTITEPQKAKTLESIVKIEDTLNGTIQTVNTVKGTLNTITAPLNTLKSVANTLNSIILVFEQVITIVKAIPLPLGAPVGVGVPANVQTGFSDTLDQTDKEIEKLKPPIEAVPDAIETINKILTPIVVIFGLVDIMLNQSIQIIIFLKLILQPNPVTQEDINSTTEEVNSGIQESLATSAGPFISSDSENNKIADDALLSQLDPNSNSPFMYRGFRLTIQHASELTHQLEPSTKSSIPSRRVVAVRVISKDNFFNETGEDIGVTLYSGYPNANISVNPKSTFSFSSSTQVLVEEAKFNIDQYLREFTNEGEDDIVNEIPSEEVVEVIPPSTPAQTLQELVEEARQNLRSRGFTQQETKWVMEESGLLVQNIVRQMNDGLTKEQIFKQYLTDMKGFSQGQVNYLLEQNSAYGWIVFIQTFNPNASADSILLSASKIYKINPYTGS